MRVKHRFGFTANEDTNSIEMYLKAKNIKYTLTTGIPIIIFEIFEDDERWNEVNTLMAKYNILSLKDCVYSKEEYNKASWFTIRSKWRWEYPQPEEAFEYKQLTYDSSNYCTECGCGLVQKESFKIKKIPNWGKRNFLMLNWIEDELFINNNVEEVLLRYNLKGFKFFNVKNIKTNKQIENMKQIYVNNILKPGLISQNNNIYTLINCHNCASNKMIETGRGIIFKKEVFMDIEYDIVKSFEVFGDGHMCARIIFVSKSFYNAVTKNNLDKDLVFEPVMLI